MKTVWVLEAFDAEPYSTASWIHGVYSTKEQANKAKSELGTAPYEEDLENYEAGFYLREPEEFPLQGEL